MHRVLVTSFTAIKLGQITQGNTEKHAIRQAPFLAPPNSQPDEAEQTYAGSGFRVSQYLGNRDQTNRAPRARPGMG